jgi:hypothetical protein
MTTNSRDSQMFAIGAWFRLGTESPRVSLSSPTPSPGALARSPAAADEKGAPVAHAEKT